MNVQGVEGVARLVWGAACSAWPLVEGTDLSVKLEEMPPGRAEIWHRHTQVRQVFFGLEGVLHMETGKDVHEVTPETALKVPQSFVPKAVNNSNRTARFLVISAADREEIFKPG